jgi:hypothetical protein
VLREPRESQAPWNTPPSDQIAHPSSRSQHALPASRATLRFVAFDSLASTSEKLYDVPMKEFSVRLRNSPGQLAALTMLLADAGVEIDALATVTDDGHSHVRFVVQNVARTRRLLMNADVSFDESEILDMFLPRGTGSLAHMVDGLARSGVNIDSLYLLHSSAEGFHVAVTVDNTDAAIEAIAG